MVLVMGVVVFFLFRKKLFNLLGQDNNPACDDARDTDKKFPHDWSPFLKLPLKFN